MHKICRSEVVNRYRKDGTRRTSSADLSEVRGLHGFVERLLWWPVSFSKTLMDFAEAPWFDHIRFAGLVTVLNVNREDTDMKRIIDEC